MEFNIYFHQQSILNAITQIKSGNYSVSYIAEVYCVFATEDFTLMCQAAQVLRDVFCSMDSSQIIRFDNLFRQHTSLEWCGEWKKIVPAGFKKVLNEEEYQWVLRVGTFHSNGFYRENCLRELSDISENLPYFMLRINDWAKPVRELARVKTFAVLENTSTKPIDVIKALPFLEKAENGMRRESDAFAILKDKILQITEIGLKQVDAKVFMELEMNLRKVLYKRLHERLFIDKERIDELIELERCSHFKTLLIRAVLRHCACTPEEVDAYLMNKFAVVRKRALDYKYEQVRGYWTGIEDMLMDRSRGIREMACYILQKHTKMDILSYYENKLKEPNLTINEIMAAISGIGENGSCKAESDKLIMPYLEHESSRVVRSAIRALSLLLQEKGADIYWKYLFDSRVTVAKSAYLAMAKYEVNYGAKVIMEAFDACDQDFTRDYLLKRLLHEPSWERLPYLLKLYHYNGNLQYKIRNSINFRGAYAQITATLAKEIQEILNKKDLELPEWLKKDIEFDLQHIAIRK